ncbi:NAD(P)-binding protein [Mycena albidolilacea]|uniref:NAD(P)-binding protein n=1 Tax=Mycena albidolilacea TaxID=1033008 RepID=A0AAD7EHF4_9AGAR|nr:NAD(P)-binding protein [Mycena albidolilacea]
MAALPTIVAANAAWPPSYVPVGIFVGGTSGIGQGIAEAFARHTHGRAHIVLIGRNEAAARAILARLPAPSSGEAYTREFIPCDLALVANAKRTSAQLAARFPRVNIVFLTAGAISLKGFDPTSEKIDRQMASLYYSKWAFIDGLLPSLRAAKQAGEDARVAAVHTAGRDIPVDLADLGLEGAMGRGMRGARSLVGQLASYQDLMAKAFGERDPTITFTHTFPGSVDTPVLRASPSLALRIAHYVRLVLRIRGEMSIDECGERQLWGLLQVRVCVFSALSQLLSFARVYHASFAFPFFLS